MKAISNVFSKYILVILVFGLSVLPAIAHENCIEGQVIIKNGKAEPVIGATVRILNTMLGTITNKKGKFHLKNIPRGKHELVITAVGLKPLHHKFEITQGLKDDLVIDFEMEEAAVQTADVVVTATRSEKIYEDTPVKVSVISDKVFEATSSVSLKEGLNFQPGLRTETNCQNCGFSQIRINGLEGKYSQVLIDGKAIFSALNGVYGLDQLPTNMIDRVEVIRGGGSSLYGGNAIAGVVNIITKEPAYNFFNFDYTQGLTDGKAPDNTISLNGSILSEKQDLGMFIFGMSRDRKEWDANSDGFTDIGRLNVKSLGARAFFKPNYQTKISGEFHTIFHETRGGDSLHLMPHFTNITEMTTHKTNSGQMQYERFFDEGINKLSLYASFQHTKRDSYYGSHQDQNAYGSTDNETYAFGAQYNHFIDNLLGYHVLTVGYEFNNDWMKDLAPAYSRIIDQTTQSNGIFIQDDWSVSEDFNLIIGSRFDKHNKINGIIISPRANFLYKIATNMSFRGNLSTGFRAPQAFDEDLHITQVGGTGLLIRVDKNLKPEYSVSFGGSLDYSTRALGLPMALSVEYFYTRLNDAFVLEYQPHSEGSNLIMLRKNGGNAAVNGGTFELQIEFLKNLELKTGLTLQSSLYDEPVKWSVGDVEKNIAPQYSKQIFRTPDLYGFFTLNCNCLEDIKLNLSGIYTGSMYVPHYAGYIQQDELTKSEAFFELNAKLSYMLFKNPGIEVSLGLYNIFNSYQRDLDKGVNRDAGYVYGAGRPFTIFWGIKTSL